MADVGMWFDRADEAIRTNAAQGTVTPVEAAPVLITLTGAAMPTGLRRSYTGSGQWRSSATALLATGRWLVKFRISSANADPAAINALLDRAIAAVTLPAEPVAGVTPIRALPPGTPIVRIVQPCTDTIRWRNASVVRSRDSGMLGALLMGALSQAPQEGEEDVTVGPPLSARPLCRDATELPDGAGGVYRVTGEPQQYWLTLSDNGLVASVGADELAGLIEERSLFAITLLDPQRTLSFPHFNRLPSPTQAWQMLNGTAPTGMVNYDPELGSDRTITISPPR